MEIYCLFIMFFVSEDLYSQRATLRFELSMVLIVSIPNPQRATSRDGSIITSFYFIESQEEAAEGSSYYCPR